MELKGMTMGKAGAARYVVIGTLAAILLLATGAIFTNVLIQAAHDRQYLSLAGELRLLSQQLPTYAREATTGNTAAFTLLEDARRQFEQKLTQLQQGDDATGMPATSGAPRSKLDTVAATWTGTNEAAKAIGAASKTITELRKTADTFKSKTPEVIIKLDEAAGLMIEGGESSRQVFLASAQFLLPARMQANLSDMLSGSTGAATAANLIAEDAATFRRALDLLIKGDKDRGVTPVADKAILAQLETAAESFSALESGVELIQKSAPEFFQMREAADTVFENARTLLTSATDLSDAYAASAGGGALTYVGYVTGVATVLMLALLGYFLYRDAQRRQAERLAEAQAREEEAEQRARETAEANRKNNAAVLNLLGEIDALQDGDLTIEASVNEAFTGAIADAINSAVETLRKLVSSIRDASAQVTTSASSTEQGARELAEASERQQRQITEATEAINSMARAMERMSREAAKSAEVAQQSMATAHTGGETVRASIGGMNTIREQIQETAKRIKRLGESSQEIGEIVGLINDIADQTSILALNAAIQASSAGEAGRGFAVVADEVQRLAERAANATRQIENLVKSIQADTNDAVISMEQTTSEVVKGARLAEDAGAALTGIEQVSKELSDLISGIAAASGQHAGGAARISDTMGLIAQFTSRTAESTRQTAQSVGALAVTADKLKESVQGFKLPG